MKSFTERNRFLIGLAGISVTLVVVAVALNYDRLPGFDSENDYSAYFAEAGGLRAGAPVQVAGYRVGKVNSVDLDGDRVLVTFKVDDYVHLGDLTEANVRTKSLLGAKVLEVTPRGDGELKSAIPLERTRSPYQLPDALGDLSKTINGLNTNSVSDALSTLANTFRDTPPALRDAVQGVARFSQTLGDRDAQLRKLLANASKSTAVLSERADEIAKLVSDTNSLLPKLRTQSSALQQISSNLSAFAQQLKSFIGENEQQLRPALDKLNGVLTLVDNRKDRLTLAIKYLNQYAMSLGEAVGSGPFFKAYLDNLPGQLVQPFIDAAFSDLGLDPNVLAPADRTDPQTGQPGTPPLPMPMPRTGQGGEPRLNIPDAITGNPGDQGCGPPGIPLPGPTGCYPYRDPGPAPAPGGPPPGPPAAGAAGAPRTEPTPTPVFVPVPGEPAHEPHAQNGSGGS
ncbi:MCE family protein [Mycobacterium sherrisii]|uniref:MCE family protein n=1 Tax=Mycobacterium sherrisii TaxID=243061 RepID=UPI000A150B4F|nr:MCE family protein [Mycobacterium sherrisii]MCV7032500.1 MCE family protein [Mycobacterium sherrisii]ORW74164.1 mammalian cell entry protein [Mycobacterium sherrisii]